MRWTHFTLPVSDLEGSIQFFTDVCGLSVVRDRRKEGGKTLWIGPKPKEGEDPVFVLVITPGEVIEPLDHFGFQCDSFKEFLLIAEKARNKGILIDGPTDAGGSIGHFLVVKEPSGHFVEFTFGQPLKGLKAIAA
jgi:catechol 2,3-dioxygenase-like lactoylglutathione lyase family enzyme